MTKNTDKCPVNASHSQRGMKFSPVGGRLQAQTWLKSLMCLLRRGIGVEAISCCRWVLPSPLYIAEESRERNMSHVQLYCLD